MTHKKASLPNRSWYRLPLELVPVAVGADMVVAEAVDLLLRVEEEDMASGVPGGATMPAFRSRK